MKLLFSAFAALACSLAAHAQSSAPSQKKAEATAAPSAFADYKKFNLKESMTDWRKANDTVEALDGHMGHVRGAPKSKAKMMEPKK